MLIEQKNDIFGKITLLLKYVNRSFKNQHCHFYSESYVYVFREIITFSLNDTIFHNIFSRLSFIYISDYLKHAMCWHQEHDIFEI